MHRKKRLIYVFVILAILAALPSAALANKQVWKAQLSAANELHEVIDSRAAGSAIIGTNRDGSLRFSLVVRGLSGPATAAHLHGPADENSNAPAVITLCGNGPAAPVVATCTTDASGTLMIEGQIRGANVSPGVTGANIFNWLNSGQSYINVHTTLNPAGESRGQVYPQ